MRVRVFASVLAVLATLVLATPVVAEPAACGDTNDQWVGTFTGTHFFYLDPTDATPLEIEVAHDGVGSLAVTTSFDGTTYAPSGETSITLARLLWHTDIPEDFWRYKRHVTTEKSCSGGVVTSFSGVYQFWTYPEGWFNSVLDFELTRTA